jgi:asparagine synthase (glutamine-hydrolysing)
MLVGTMGNSTISYGGFDLIGAILAKGQIGRFLSEWAAARKQGVAARTLLRGAAAQALPRSIVRALRSFRNRERHPATAGIANPAANGLDGILERFDSYQEGFDSSARSRARAMRRVDPGTYNKGVLLGWGIDLRDPTGDRRLVEYCLQVPLRLYLRGGTARALARDALRGRVPEKVLVEPQRGLQSPHWFSMLSNAREEAARQLSGIAQCPVARTLIDIEKMRRLMEEWPDPATVHGPAIYRYGLLRGLSAGGFIRLHSAPGDPRTGGGG